MIASNEMERQLQDAPPHFLPCVGYGCASRHRILMLGEANHGTEQDETNRNDTRTTVRSAIADSLPRRKLDHFIRYIRNTEAMVLGKACGDSDRVWGSLACSVFSRPCALLLTTAGNTRTRRKETRPGKFFRHA